MFRRKRRLRLWWHQNNGVNNFGDILNPYLVGKISGLEPSWTEIKRFSFRPIYLVIGSILSIATKKCIVWGAGIISKDDVFGNAKFLAVRGPLSGKRIEELGFVNPCIYGDPALVLPIYYQPKVEKEFEIGIIPHHVDYDFVKTQVVDKRIRIINLVNEDVTEVIDEICSCKRTISSSLHGLIVSHTYGIPSLWAEFSKKLFGDGVKFADYFLSVGISPYSPINYTLIIPSFEELITLFEEHQESVLVDKASLDLLVQRLLSVCPFKSGQK